MTTHTAEDYKGLVVPATIDELELLSKTDIPIPHLDGLTFEPDTSNVYPISCTCNGS